MTNKRWWFGDIEITFREILLSIIAILVMIMAGMPINAHIQTKNTDKLQQYEQAIQINSADEFKYGMDTAVGKSLDYGKMVALDPVTYPEIDGQYLSIRRTHEHYTMHTRTVVHSCGKGCSYTTTEVYYSWDYSGEEYWQSKKVKYLGQIIEIKKLNLWNFTERELTTVTKGYDRWIYDVRPVSSKGTLYTTLSKKGISNNSPYYAGRKQKEVIEKIRGDTTKYSIIFWVIWMIITAIIVAVICGLENYWLNED